MILWQRYKLWGEKGKLTLSSPSILLCIQTSLRKKKKKKYTNCNLYIYIYTLHFAKNRKTRFEQLPLFCIMKLWKTPLTSQVTLSSIILPPLSTLQTVFDAPIKALLFGSFVTWTFLSSFSCWIYPIGSDCFHPETQKNAGNNYRNPIRNTVFCFSMLQLSEMVMAIVVVVLLATTKGVKSRKAREDLDYFEYCAMSCRAHSASLAEFGGVGDGSTSNTKAFQAAINHLSQYQSDGGAQLFVPPGKWLTGSFNLTSHFTLYLHKDAVLLASQVRKFWWTISLNTNGWLFTFGSL